MNVDLHQARSYHPAESTAAGCPRIVTVTGLASLFAPVNTCPAGTAGLAGPKPLPHRIMTSPGLAGVAPA